MDQKNLTHSIPSHTTQDVSLYILLINSVHNTFQINLSNIRKEIEKTSDVRYAKSLVTKANFLYAEYNALLSDIENHSEYI